MEEGEFLMTGELYVGRGFRVRNIRLPGGEYKVTRRRCQGFRIRNITARVTKIRGVPLWYVQRLCWWILD